jgi:nucleoside phosphorylase
MKTTILVFAMEAEQQAFLDVLTTPVQKLSTHHETMLSANHIVKIVLSGITMLQCYRLLPFLNNPIPNEVIQVGTCAGLRNQAIGEVVHAKTFFNNDLDLTTFGRPLGRLFVGKKPTIVHPVLVSGSMFLASKEASQKVIDRFDADAFDMESFGFFTMCETLHIPFTSIRGVSDNGQTHANQSFEKNLAFASKQAAQATLTYLKKKS